MRGATAMLHVIVLATCGCARVDSPDIGEVIARNVDARGGRGALARIQQIAIELDLTERGQTVHGLYKADRRGLVRVDIYAGGVLVYSEGIDSAGVWNWPASEPAPRESAATGAANALAHGADFHLYGLHGLAERGHTLTLMPADTVAGIPYHVIRVRFNTGHVSYFYVDSGTALVTRRRDERAYHPDVDSTKQRIESRFSEFAESGGALFADRTDDIDLASGAQLSTAQVRRREVNPGISTLVFSRYYKPPDKQP
jgi:hypothetical protein